MPFPNRSLTDYVVSIIDHPTAEYKRRLAESTFVITERFLKNLGKATALRRRRRK